MTHLLGHLGSFIGPGSGVTVTMLRAIYGSHVALNIYLDHMRRKGAGSVRELRVDPGMRAL